MEKRYFADGVTEYGQTDFTVEIIMSFDGVRDCFLVQFEPGGYMYGRIDRNSYYVPLSCNYVSSIIRTVNDFDKLEIEPDNRYINVGSDTAPAFGTEVSNEIVRYSMSGATEYKETILTEAEAIEWGKNIRHHFNIFRPAMKL